MTTIASTTYEVEAEFLELKDEQGHRHWLKRGEDLPAWVPSDRVSELVQSGAVLAFGSI